MTLTKGMLRATAEEESRHWCMEGFKTGRARVITAERSHTKSLEQHKATISMRGAAICSRAQHERRTHWKPTSFKHICPDPIPCFRLRLTPFSGFKCTLDTPTRRRWPQGKKLLKEKEVHLASPPLSLSQKCAFLWRGAGHVRVKCHQAHPNDCH